jgi:MFS family permease
MSQTEAAFLLGAQSFLGVPATLFLGWLGDRINKAKLMAVCMLFAMLSMLVLIFGQEHWQIWFFLPLFTVVEATFPVNWSCVGEFFGRANFAKIRGVMVFVQAWGAVIGPVVAGAIYDRTQSYVYLLWGLVGVLLIVGGLYALIVKPAAALGSETAPA